MARRVFRNRLGELVEIPEVAASQAKNSFGELLDRVATAGAVAITRHDTPKAVLLSLEEFESLSSTRAETLEALSAKFEGLLERLQTPAARNGLEAAFNATRARGGRVSRGGHPIPEETIRRRYERSRLNLIQLLPSLAAARRTFRRQPRTGRSRSSRPLFSRVWAEPRRGRTIEDDRPPGSPSSLLSARSVANGGRARGLRDALTS